MIYPFTKKILYNSESNTFRTLVYIDKKIVNKPERKKLIEEFLIPKIDDYNKKI
jgi:hypothetical protein